MAAVLAPPRFVDDAGDASDADDVDGEGYDNGTQTPLDRLGNSLKVNCNMKSSYTTWGAREAFRELVQNWRDGIIKSFKLAETSFRVKPKKEYLIKNISEVVYNAVVIDASGVEQCLGYIRFMGRDGEGTVDIVNRKAILEPQYLVHGATSKTGTGTVGQAGKFGEGLKVAAVVMLRGAQNHHMQCRSGGFTWTFNFDKHSILVTHLRRMTRDRIARDHDQAARQAKRLQLKLPFVPNPDDDVHFILGQGRRGISDKGEPIKRNAVTRAQFDAWTTAALFLQTHAGEDAVVETWNGDLLVAPQFRGMIYLKGLLLHESTAVRSASRTSLPLRFGYNFASGTTDRDRSSVASADEEGRAILAIWNAALAVRPDIVAELSAMMNSTEPKYADVLGARKYMSMCTAMRLLNHLIDGDRAGNWYYCSEEAKMNPRLDAVIRGLGRNGVQLTRTYWDVLRRHALVRTAEEEEIARFTAAPCAPAPTTEFARRMCQLLAACLRACPQTDGMGFTFVDAGPLGLQLALSDDDANFRIHDRWLSLEGATAELCLRGALAEAEILYHAVKSLFSDALDQLPLESFVGRDSGGDGHAAMQSPERRKKLETSLAEQRLLNYLRIENLTVDVVAGRPELRVQWPVDAQWNAGTEIEIQCHCLSTCSYPWDRVQIASDVPAVLMPCMDLTATDNDYGPKSTCRSSRLISSIGEHLETDLEGGEAYFFAVVMTPTDPGAFVSFSSRYDCSTRRSPSPVPAVPAVPIAPSAVIATECERDVVVIDEDGGEPLPQPATGGPVSTAANKPAGGQASGHAGGHVGGRYDTGPELSELDVLSIRRWHAAKSFGSITDNVVIGIRTEEKVARMAEGRKRIRII